MAADHSRQFVLAIDIPEPYLVQFDAMAALQDEEVEELLARVMLTAFWQFCTETL